MFNHQPNHADPYSNQPAPYESYPNYPHQSTSNYADDANYDDAPRYPTYAGDPSGEYHQSTEKILDEPAYGTERAQPGRSGLRPKSFAEMGPPPRSTGILREWRKGKAVV
jgi:hypothetical protein